MSTNIIIAILAVFLAFLLLVLADNRLTDIERQLVQMNAQVNALQGINDESDCVPKSLY